MRPSHGELQSQTLPGAIDPVAIGFVFGGAVVLETVDLGGAAVAVEEVERHRAQLVHPGGFLQRPDPVGAEVEVRSLAPLAVEGQSIGSVGHFERLGERQQVAHPFARRQLDLRPAVLPRPQGAALPERPIGVGPRRHRSGFALDRQARRHHHPPDVFKLPRLIALPDT